MVSFGPGIGHKTGETARNATKLVARVLCSRFELLACGLTVSPERMFNRLLLAAKTRCLPWTLKRIVKPPLGEPAQ